MSQNTKQNEAQKQWNQYQQTIGRYFDCYRMDLIFSSQTIDGKPCENHYNLMNGIEMWLDSLQDGILLVVRSSASIDGEFATQLSITVKAEHGSYIFDVVEKTAQKYANKRKCLVFIQTLPIMSAYVKPQVKN